MSKLAVGACSFENSMLAFATYFILHVVFAIVSK